MDALNLIDRTIVALQAGQPLPPDVAQIWEVGLIAYRDTPSACFETIMGFKGRQGKRSVGYEYARRQQIAVLKRHYREYHEGVRSKSEASSLIAEAFQEIEDAHPVAIFYASLYRQLALLPFALPSQTHLYRLLRRFS